MMYQNFQLKQSLKRYLQHENAYMRKIEISKVIALSFHLKKNEKKAEIIEKRVVKWGQKTENSREN